MKKDVLIEVENTQTLGGRDEKYTVSVNGTLEYGDGRYTLAYTEYDGELKGCKTLVTVEGGDSVSVAREGGYSTELKLKNGEAYIQRPTANFRSDFLRTVFSRICRKTAARSKPSTQ